MMANVFLINGMTVETLKVFRNLTKEEVEKYTVFLESKKCPHVSVSDPISTIAFTGHRYVQEDEMQTALDEVARQYPGAIWICGGAIGVDSFVAKYAMNHNIKYQLILPFSPEVMSKYWNDVQKNILKETMAKALSVTVLRHSYDVTFYQRRNVAMVDAAQILIAFFDGSSGGTANCVKYAQTKNGYSIIVYPGPYKNPKKKHSFF
jgi:uncharacterized phage-like protein YoqJ